MEGFKFKSNEYQKFFGRSIDYFIGGISLEDRGYIGSKILHENNIRIGQKIIFKFEEVISNAKQTELRKINFEKKLYMGKNDELIEAKLSDEREGLKKLRKLNNIEKNLKDKIILIDVSSLIKPYIFLLLKYFNQIIESNSIYLLYTEPSEYKNIEKNKFQLKEPPFTKGISEITGIMGYSCNKDIRKKEALIILLGFEGGRAIRTMDKVDPDVTIPINGFPSYKPHYKDISIILNEEILKEPATFKKIKFSPANDPFETKKILERIYNKYSTDYNLTIAPLGTKPMAIGSCLFSLEYSNCRIIYPYPKDYVYKVSKGYGKSWTYLVPLK